MSDDCEKEWRSNSSLLPRDHESIISVLCFPKQVLNLKGHTLQGSAAHAAASQLESEQGHAMEGEDQGSVARREEPQRSAAHAGLHLEPAHPSTQARLLTSIPITIVVMQELLSF